MGFPWSPALCRCPMSLSIDEDCVRLRSPCIWPRPWSALCQCHCDVPPSRPTVGALFPFISVFIIMSASNLICFRVLADLNGRVSLIHCIDMPNGKLEMFRWHRPDLYMNKWSATVAFRDECCVAWIPAAFGLARYIYPQQPLIAWWLYEWSTVWFQFIFNAPELIDSVKWCKGNTPFFYAAVAAAQLSKWRWTVEWGGVGQSADGHISPVRLDHNDLNYA